MKIPINNSNFTNMYVVEVEAVEITWSISQTQEMKDDGSLGPYERSALREDPGTSEGKSEGFCSTSITSTCRKLIARSQSRHCFLTVNHIKW